MQEQESTETDFQGAFVDVTGVRLHYLHAGSGTPMFLIHGLVGSCANWRNNIGALAQNAAVYAIDLLNMGESERVEDLDVSLKATSNCIVAAMDSLGIAAADIVAHSYGGAIALMLAALHTQRVRRLILFAPANPYSRSSDLVVHIYSSAWGRLIARMLPHLPAPIQRIALGPLYGGLDRVPDTCLQEIVDGLRCPGTLRHVLSIVHCWFDQMTALKAVLHRVAQIPTLLVWGDSDCTVSLSSGIRLHKKLRASEFIVVPGGHSLFEESPQQSNRIMLDWLSRHSLPTPFPAIALDTSAPGTSASLPADLDQPLPLNANAPAALETQPPESSIRPAA